MGWDGVAKELVVVGIDEGWGIRGESRVDVYVRDLRKMPPIWRHRSLGADLSQLSA
jgi:hypothetical protein